MANIMNDILYNKRNNDVLFDKMIEKIDLEKIQNYTPMYDIFFNLTEKNYKHVNLNHQWSMNTIGENEILNDKNIIKCNIKNTSNYKTKDTNVFIKLAPLLDPYKYLSGKYIDSDISNLPSIENNTNVHKKILNKNNSSYIDNLFYFLISRLFNHGFVHGISYYGSFLAIKKNYKIDVIDDLEYLVSKNFFKKQKGILFDIDDYSHICIDTKQNIKPLNICNDILFTNIGEEEIDNNIFDDVFNDNSINNSESIEEVHQLSNTIDDEITLKPKNNMMSDSEESESDVSESDVSESDSDSTDSSYSTLEEDVIYATIKKFPVQLICMDNCEETFHSLIISNTLSSDEWFSAFMQIIMTLITYNDLFSFTHNDLHTNNIMYVKTSKQYLIYLYKGVYYRVPTFGRIYKIIDFGRSIYKFNDHLFCSDSYDKKGDASSQYNTEPFFNEKKMRVDPNPSFDLCRLGCSIIDYMFDSVTEFEDINSLNSLERIIIEWCTDDSGQNVMYTKSGNERYHDFDLYKMIARTVHNHTPINQLNKLEFKKYIVQENTAQKYLNNSKKNYIFVSIDKLKNTKNEIKTNPHTILSEIAKYV